MQKKGKNHQFQIVSEVSDSWNNFHFYLSNSSTMKNLKEGKQENKLLKNNEIKFKLIP